MRYPIKRLLPALLVTSLTAACAVTPEVQELAKTTASNASVVNTQLADFAKFGKQTAERRAEAAANLLTAVERERASFDTYMESARSAAVISGTDKKPNFGTLVVELRRVADVIDRRRREIDARKGAVREEILASQSALTIPKENLAIVAQKAAALSTPASRGEQLAFYRKFLAEVVSSIKEAKKAAKESADIAGTASEKAADSAAKSPEQDGNPTPDS
tara:strand:- start:1338 stop:1994 length:657 start_codon:yes stop_codon:yes gene_type:complete